MPTILVENGFRLYFYPNENFEPPHVHVQYQSAVAKFWVGPVALASNKGMKTSDLKRAGDLVRKHEKLIQEKWNEFFSKKK
jgi:hypothetical protein